MKKKLYKSNKSRMVAGVCGGIAEFFNIDPTIVRLIMVVLACLRGAGLLIYIIACIIIPADESGSEFSDDNIDNLKSANVDSEDGAGSESKEKKSGKKKADSSTSGKGHSDKEFDEFFSK